MKIVLNYLITSNQNFGGWCYSNTKFGEAVVVKRQAITDTYGVVKELQYVATDLSLEKAKAKTYYYGKPIYSDFIDYGKEREPYVGIGEVL